MLNTKQKQYLKKIIKEEVDKILEFDERENYIKNATQLAKIGNAAQLIAEYLEDDLNKSGDTYLNTMDDVIPMLTALVEKKRKKLKI